MTQHNEDLFSASFEYMSIGTQYSDSSNDANVFPPYIMSYDQPSLHPSLHPSSHPLGSIGKYGMINHPHDPQMPFQIPYQKQQGFQTSMWVNPEFPIHREVVGTSQAFMHDMFDLIINIIGTLYLGVSIVFIKMGSLRQILQWSHIDLYFGFERPFQSNINVYISLFMSFLYFLQSIFMNFKVFLLIFNISIFM